MSGSAVPASGEVLPFFCIGTTRSCWAGIPSYPAALSGSTGLELLSWLLQGPQTGFPHVLLGCPKLPGLCDVGSPGTTRPTIEQELRTPRAGSCPQLPTVAHSGPSLPQEQRTTAQALGHCPEAVRDDTGKMRVCFYSYYPGSVGHDISSAGWAVHVLDQ